MARARALTRAAAGPRGRAWTVAPALAVRRRRTVRRSASTGPSAALILLHKVFVRLLFLGVHVLWRGWGPGLIDTVGAARNQQNRPCKPRNAKGRAEHTSKHCDTL